MPSGCCMSANKRIAMGWAAGLTVLLWITSAVAETWTEVPSAPSTGGGLTWQKVTCDDGTGWQPCRIPPTPPPPPPPPGPSPGDTFPLTAMVCGPGDSGYYSVSQVPDYYRGQLIDTYTSFGQARRCPDVGGYNYWLGELESNSATQGYSFAWQRLQPTIAWAARQNDEGGQGGINNANRECQDAANSRYGFGVARAEYIIGSGKYCRII